MMDNSYKMIKYLFFTLERSIQGRKHEGNI